MKGGIFIVKSELIDKTWKDIGKKVEKEKMTFIINAFIETICKEIKKDNRVKIEGLGSFYSSYSKSYNGKDINTGKNKIIPETKYIRFKPSSKLKS